LEFMRPTERMPASFIQPIVSPSLRAAVLGTALAVLAACQTTGTTAPETQAQGGGPMDGTQLTLYESARDAEAKRNYEQAAAVYGRLFERRHDDPIVLAAFIRNMRYSDRAVEITGYVENKTQHLLGDVNVKFEFAKALLAAGRKQESLSQLVEVEALMPGNWQVYSAKGITLDALERYAEAQQAYAQALAVSPKNAVVMNNKAMSLATWGRLAEAIKTLEAAAGINRTHPHIRQNLALLYAIDGNMDRAHALAAMDLDVSDLETNLSFYRRFEGAAK